MSECRLKMLWQVMFRLPVQEPCTLTNCRCMYIVLLEVIYLYVYIYIYTFTRHALPKQDLYYICVCALISTVSNIIYL